MRWTEIRYQARATRNACHARLALFLIQTPYSLLVARKTHLRLDTHYYYYYYCKIEYNWLLSFTLAKH